MIPAMLGGWTQHDDASAVLAADVVTALQRADLSNFAASIYMWRDEKHESELSHALAGRRCLNAYLLVRLPLAFWRHFLALRAQRIGCELIDYGVFQVLSDVRALLRRDQGGV